MRLPRAALLALLALGAGQACAEKRAPPAGDGLTGVGSDGSGDGGLLLEDGGNGKPAGPCGEQRIPAVDHPPNLSFILDRSASMGDILPGSDLSKYENARVALSKVLRAVGHRVHYGVSVFPGFDGATGCEPGVQLLPVEQGDDPSYARTGQNGPRLQDMLKRLSQAGVSGGTPAAASLLEALPELRDLPEASFAVLITDGAPNCNEQLRCDESGCIPNIEGLSYNGQNCTQGVNCCAPTRANPGANLSCIDDAASLHAVEALAAAGVRTFVVGMPGSEPYEALLDATAEAGGTARQDEPKYYSVAATQELEKSLTAIAANVAISCDLTLDYGPPDPDYVNVYFDEQLVEADPTDGWAWTDDGHVSIRGRACDSLTRGEVLEVQIFAGCRTQVK